MEIKKEKSFGVIPISKNKNGDTIFCLIKHNEAHWAFPKGHPDKNETGQETALRELKEETGIVDISLLKTQSFIEKYSFNKDHVIHDKSVEYFIGLTSSVDTKTLKEFEKEISELRWVTYQEGKSLVTFKEGKETLEQVFNYLQTID